MELEKLKQIIESLILVSEEPITVSEIQKVFDDGIDKSEIKEAIRLLQEKYTNDATTGIHIREVAGGYQIVTKPELAVWVQKLNQTKPVRLSQAAMETLAIVAYRQPVVRSDVENIRGVDTGGVLKTLLERGLIRIVGRRDEPGNPLIYGTTPQFMELFGLAELKDLPSLKDFEELQKDKTQTAAAAGGETSVEDDTLPVTEEEVMRAVHEEWEDDEQKEVIGDLEEGIKRLRQLEGEIFPKLKTELPVDANAQSGGANATEQQIQSVQPNAAGQYNEEKPHGEPAGEEGEAAESGGTGNGVV